MTLDLPTLIISRKPRLGGSDWDEARSWFGGRPQLGNQPWPQGAEQQTPFYFLAQIDLGEVREEIERCGKRIDMTDGL